MVQEKLGLAAGGGQFPFLVARGAKKAGLKVVCLGFRGLAEKELTSEVDRFVWVDFLRIGQWIRVLKGERVDKVIIGGVVRKADMYNPLTWLRYIPDGKMVRIWYQRSKDHRTDSLLLALADILAEEGITMVNSVQFCKDDLAGAGPMGSKNPSQRHRKDIAFGWKIAKAMGGLDVGQSVCVRDLEVIAVEAIEGTDQTICRAGQLCRVGGFTVVKVAKPNQDMRFDVPTIGPDTLKVMHQAGASVLAVEAGKTIVINRKRVRELAEKYGIVVVGISDEQLQSEKADAEFRRATEPVAQ